MQHGLSAIAELLVLIFHQCSTSCTDNDDDDDDDDDDYVDHILYVKCLFLVCSTSGSS